jgi:hypothetical protein
VYGEAHTFRWDGICWTPAIILERVAWVAGAMLVVALTMLIFAQTRTAPGNGVGGRRGPRRGKPSPIREGAGLPLAQRVRLPALPEGKVRFRFVPVLRAELRLALGCQPWWWHLGALGWAVGGLLAPAEVSRQYLLPAAWLWPVPIWSAMGTRETHYRTDGLVFSTPHPLRRQLPAIWLSGLVVALATGSGAALRLILTGDWAALAAWAVGASFVPALALALGVWSGRGKAFEGFYSVLWYVGPVNQLVALDFMGATDKAVAAGVPLRFLALTVLLLGLAAAGRGRQIRLG